MSLKLRPSEASRWLKCTISPHLIAINKDRIPEESSWYADEGTKAHELAAEALILGYDETEFPNAEMAEFVLDYVLYVQSHVTKGSKLQVEREISVFYKHDQRGFVDAIIVKPRGFTVIDLKYGAGVSVQAFENPQIVTYGLSVYHELKAKGHKFRMSDPVELVIYQPRVRGEDAIREWTMTLGELIEWGKVLVDTAKKILANPAGGKFHADEKTCQFCDARPFCSAYTAMLFDDLPLDMDETLDFAEPVDEPDLKSLTPDQIARAILIGPKLAKWISACSEYVTAMLKEGKPDFDKHFKLVASVTHRKWVDEVDAELLLSEQLSEEERTSSSVITPAQAEKVLKRKKVSKAFMERFNQTTERPPGGPSLVSVSDPRPPFQEVNVHEEFDSLDPE